MIRFWYTPSIRGMQKRCIFALINNCMCACVQGGCQLDAEVEVVYFVFGRLTVIAGWPWATQTHPWVDFRPSTCVARGCLPTRWHGECSTCFGTTVWTLTFPPTATQGFLLRAFNNSFQQIDSFSSWRKIWLISMRGKLFPTHTRTSFPPLPCTSLVPFPFLGAWFWKMWTQTRNGKFIWNQFINPLPNCHGWCCRWRRWGRWVLLSTEK